MYIGIDAFMSYLTLGGRFLLVIGSRLYLWQLLKNFLCFFFLLIYGRTTTSHQNMIFTAIWFALWKKNFKV